MVQIQTGLTLPKTSDGNVEKDITMNTVLSELRDIMELLIESEGSPLKPASEDRRIGLQTRSECEINTITAGISALGSLMAIAAINEDWGHINNQEIADIGFLLQWLGKMQIALNCINDEAKFCLDRS